MAQNDATFAFGGGLDTNSAALAVSPSSVISSMNYEPLAEGYGRQEGFERFDGQAAPSGALFWLMDFDNGAQPILQGHVLMGATSGATGTVLLPVIDFTGSWSLATAAGTVLLANVTGTFEDGETLQVSLFPFAVANGTATPDSAPNEALRVLYLETVQAWHRERIAKVPGEGPVRGVAVHDGTVFAWRDAIGGVSAEMFKATAAGWVSTPAVRLLPFSTGVYEVFEGGTITGGTSGATSEIVSVVVTFGSFANSDATGYLIIKDVSGTYLNENIYSGANLVAAGGTTTAQGFPPGGRYRTISHNFYGASDRYRLYGVNGVGKGFEVVGDAPVFITTGMVEDMPQRVFEIGNHLGFTFRGGSLQFSSTGEPLEWLPLTGAGEIGLGTELTDVVQANETAVAVFGAQKIAMLTGTDSSNFSLDTLTEEAGADPDTAQRVARTVYLDKRGLRSLDATQAYGNFKAGALSGQFEAYFKIKRKAGAKAIGSFLSRTKSQYRLVWDDGTGLSVYMGGKKPEAMTFEFDDMRPYCFGQGEMSDGEGIFIGAEDGYVYRIDSGTNFDGTRIRAFCVMPFNHFGSAMREERFHSLTLEMDCPAFATIGVTAQFDYGDGEQPISGERTFMVTGSSANSNFIVSGGGGSWDATEWNDFYWSQPVEGIADCPLDGVGRNASFIFATNAGLTEERHVLQAYTVFRTPRKMRRR